jgi:NADPH:quinone reductase-like Zn-dependent oxidoreductase
VPKQRRGIRTNPYDGIAGRAQWERLARAITAAPFQVPIAAEFALAEAARAHERLAQGHILGKVVLRISQ